VIRAVRVHDVGAAGPGARYLVDRLWPRGVAKEALHLAGWARDAAPSDDLRRWFGHDPARWEEFRARYTAELEASPDAWRPLLDAALEGDVLLLYAARDEEHNNAVVLREHLERQPAPARARPDPGADDLGGDAACWLHRVCPECGRLCEDGSAQRCPSCGSPLPEP
jgi:uncharacterized protein YeaO (DUF488 family)